MTNKKSTDCAVCVRDAALTAWVVKPVIALAAVFAFSGGGDIALHESVAQTASKGVSSILPSLQNLSFGSGLKVER